LSTYQIIPKHFWLHTTETSLGLPESHFCRSFTFCETIKAPLQLYNLNCQCMNISKSAKNQAYFGCLTNCIAQWVG